MELLCLEVLGHRPAGLDPHIYGDPRVLRNLLHLEGNYLPKRYFSREIQPYMRKVVTNWMLEVCEEQCCEEQVFPLAVNFFDRFLTVCQVKSSQLQLTAAATLLLASKVRTCVPLSVKHLSYCTANSVSTSDIIAWEMLILSKLGWEICGITGFDFIDVFLENLHFSSRCDLLRSHALTLLALAYTDPELIGIKGSALSCAALTAAARGLRLSPDILNDVCLLAKCQPNLVKSIIVRIEMALAEEALHHNYSPSFALINRKFMKNPRIEEIIVDCFGTSVPLGTPECIDCIFQNKVAMLPEIVVIQGIYNSSGHVGRASYSPTVPPQVVHPGGQSPGLQPGTDAQRVKPIR